MTNDPIIIVGAGPAGLTATYELMKAGYQSILFEKCRIVGGISRTESYRGLLRYGWTSLLHQN